MWTSPAADRLYSCFWPRRGHTTIATGGAKRNPWSTEHRSSSPKGANNPGAPRADVLSATFGAECIAYFHGYRFALTVLLLLAPLRGQNNAAGHVTLPYFPVSGQRLSLIIAHVVADAVHGVTGTFMNVAKWLAIEGIKRQGGKEGRNEFLQVLRQCAMGKSVALDGNGRGCGADTGQADGKQFNITRCGWNKVFRETGNPGMHPLQAQAYFPFRRNRLLSWLHPCLHHCIHGGQKTKLFPIADPNPMKEMHKSRVKGRNNHGMKPPLINYSGPIQHRTKYFVDSGCNALSEGKRRAWRFPTPNKR